MRFILIDKILEMEPEKSVRALKTLSLGEEYLGDHFPGRPIMPGVMMTESMVETASWLVRVTERFKHSMVTLKEARNVKYNHFISPGDSLNITAEWLKRKDGIVSVKAAGCVNGSTAVSGRFDLEVYNLADRDPSLASTDKMILDALKVRFNILASEQVRSLVDAVRA